QPKNRERFIWIELSTLLLIAAVAFAIAYFSRPSTAGHAIRLSLGAPDKASIPMRLTVSPDGQLVTFVANNAEGISVFWVPACDPVPAPPLAGSEGATSPFWSPEGH